MFKDRRLYHLSHIDLDGYSCQLLSSYIFEDKLYYNSNYGKEIRTRVDEIFDDIEKQDKSRKIFILITDLNLTEDEAGYLESKKQSSGYTIHLQLLDHHITGKSVAEKFQWYHLNDKKSATLITYEFFKKNNFGFDENLIPDLDRYVNSVNALDLWIQDEVEPFEYGKVMMKLISSARELNKLMFAEVDNQYKIALLNGAKKIYLDSEIDEKDKNIYLDNNMHQLKKEFFKQDSDDTLDNMLTDFIVKLLSEKHEQFTVTYKGYKGLLSSMLGNTSIIGNGFLMKNPDFDFFIDVSGKGNIGLRANGKVDVSIMAKELGNGGGHVNASGGRIKNYRESYVYQKIRTNIQSLMIEKEYTANILPHKSKK